MLERLLDCSFGGRRLWRLSASRRTPRYVLADSGREGCESLLKNVEKANEEVVGRVNEKGMVV